VRASLARRLLAALLATALASIGAGPAAAASSFNGIGIEARITSIDTSTESATIRIAPHPLGSFDVSPNANVLTRDVVLYTNTVDGSLAHSYRKGDLMDPFEATVPVEGDTSTYPFHHLKVGIAALARTGGGVRSGTPVQIQLRVTSSLAGYRVSPNPATAQGDLIQLNLHVDPSWATVLFAVFMMVVMWALALGAVAVVVNLLTRRRRFEGSFATLLAALLFAFPTVRNALPGIPPVGVLFDYAAFLWAEAIVAIALISLLAGWSVRALVGTGER
jgi:hypothetical protein